MPPFPVVCITAVLQCCEATMNIFPGGGGTPDGVMMVPVIMTGLGTATISKSSKLRNHGVEVGQFTLMAK